MKNLFGLMSVVLSLGAVQTVLAEEASEGVPIKKKPFVLKAENVLAINITYNKADESDKASITKKLEENPGCIVPAIEAVNAEFKEFAKSREMVALQDKTRESVSLQSFTIGYSATRPRYETDDRLDDLLDVNVTTTFAVSLPVWQQPKIGMFCNELFKTGSRFRKCSQINAQEVEVSVELGAFAVGTPSNGTCSPLMRVSAKSEINKEGAMAERLTCDDVGLRLCSPSGLQRKVFESKRDLEVASKRAGEAIDTVLAAEKKAKEDAEEKERKRVKEEQNRKRLQQMREDADKRTRQVLDEAG